MEPILVVASIFIVYIVFVYLMYRRILPMVWALPILAMLIGLIAGIPNSSYIDIVTKGSLYFADFNVTAMLGTIFAASLMETGIIDSLVRRAIELGGGRPLTTAIIIFLVWSYICTGTFAAGPVMVGVITLPVQVAIGIPPVLAATFHTFGQGAGMPFWIAHWTYFKNLTGVYLGDYANMALAMMVAVIIIGLVYIVYQFKREKLTMRWATQSTESEKEKAKKVPVYSYVCVALPIAFALILKWDPKVAFMASIPFPFILTHPGSGRSLKDYYGLMERSAYKGVTLLAELLAIMIFVGWVVQAASITEVRQPFIDVFKPVLPTNPMLFVLFFAILMPFCLFRGPAAPWGIGAVLAMVFSQAGVLPPLTILGAFYSYNIFMGICEPTWGTIIWTTSFLKINPLDLLKKVFVWAFIVGFVLLCIVAISWVPI
jgi:Mg2+/citrate symporter